MERIIGVRDASADTLEWLTTSSAKPYDVVVANSSELPPSITFDEVDLGALTIADGFTIQGAAGGDQSGDAVSIVGDINGDGFDDFLVGARTGANGQGEAYLIFGAGAAQDIDLSALDASAGITISGAAAGDNLGVSVSSAGDVNGDGIVDLIVGARNADGGGNNAGEAYVIFGGTSLTDIDVSNLSPQDGFTIEGGSNGDRAGQSVSAAGDINGDGIADLLIASPFADSATVIFGREDISDIDLGNFSELQGFVIDGPTRIGESVGLAGDVNNDGFDDLILGAPRGTANGSAYVVFGGNTLSDIDVRTADTTRSIEIMGEAQFDQAGTSVSGAGDVNGDGIDDFIVGARLNDSNGNNSGEAYVLFGGNSLSDIDLGTLIPAEGFAISGAGAGDTAGRAVSAAGDINGDGFGDLIIGVPGGDAGGNNSGETVILFGGSSLGDVIIDSISPTQGFVIAGDTNNDAAGQAVSGAGDINGDGFDDLLVGASGNDAGGRNAGASYIIFGGATGTESTDPIMASGTLAADNFTGNAGTDVFDLIGTDDVVRSGAGDDSISITATDFAAIDGGRGTDVVLFEASGLDLDLTLPGIAGLSSIEMFDIRGTGANAITLNQRSVFNLTEQRTGGQTVLTIRADADDTVNVSNDFVANGQVTLDGITFDIFESGNAILRIEAGTGLGTVPGPVPLSNAARVLEFDDVDPATGIFIQGDTNGDRAGFSVSNIGDLNGDGLDDVLVGAPNGDNGGANAGEAYVVFGGVSLTDIDLTSLSPADGFIIQGDTDGDETGFSVSGVGDVNGDGFTDVWIGARSGDNGGSNAGEGYLIFGSATPSDIDLSTLGTDQGIIVQGAGSGGRTGYAVSGAGDINGDGLDDLFISAPFADEAFVVFGDANLMDLDLSNLGSAGFRLSGINQLGRSITNIGDFDGDGANDIALGAPLFGSEGTVFVLTLSTGSQSDIDLGSLDPDQGFSINGVAQGDQFGIAVTGLGDVNGDGLADIAIGARLNDEGGSQAGAAYVVYGQANGGSLDLANLAPADGFQIIGEDSGDNLGRSISSAGDVNGDGFADVIIGAPGANNAGRAYVIFGGDALADINLDTLTDSQGFILQGDGNNDQTGFAVSSAGDVNGDGFDDLIIGAYQGDNGGAGAGEAVIIFGGATGTESSTSVNLAGTGAADNFTGNAGADTFTGISTGDVVRAGAGDDSVSIATLDYADINGGSGTDTVLLDDATLSFDLTGFDNGSLTSIEVFDISGTGDNTLVLDRLAVLNVTEERSSQQSTITVLGDPGDTVDLTAGEFTQAGTVFGIGGTGSAGDTQFNVFIDGNARVLVEVGVTVAGVEQLQSVIDLATLSANEGFIIQGDSAGDYAGYSVSDAGDVNGDGFDDIIIGANRGDDGGYNAGEAYVIFGGAGGFGTNVSGRQVIDLTSLSASEGFIIQGDTDYDYAGLAVSGAGDINGDGFADLIIGAPYGYDGGINAGEAYLVFGGSAPFGSAVGGRQVLDLSGLSLSEGFVIQGDSDFDLTGFSVSSAGDVNNDGYDDVILGALFGGNTGSFGTAPGEAFVLFGGLGTFGTDVSGRQTIDLSTLSAVQGFIIQGDSVSDYAGVSVSSAGDINGDGFSDILVGAYGGDDGGAGAGEAYIIFGSNAGFGSSVSGRQVVDLSGLSASEGFIIQGDAEGDNAGYSVTDLGDINGDSIDDFAVSARFGDDGGTNSGETYVIFGSQTGFGADVMGRQVLDLTTLAAGEGVIVQGDAAGDEAGYSISSAGDVNGDGFDDLIIGAVNGDNGGINAGEAYLIFGGAAGFGETIDGRQVLDLTTLNSSQGFIIQGDEAGDGAGGSVSGAGDINNDGFDDLIIGAARGGDGGELAGEAYVIFGSATIGALPGEISPSGDDPILFSLEQTDDVFVGLLNSLGEITGHDQVLTDLSSEEQFDDVDATSPFDFEERRLDPGDGAIIFNPTEDQIDSRVFTDLNAINTLIEG